jgi:phage-related minor tail protein
MGEAGPEAIMPLTRGADGKLGVEAQPTSQNTNNVKVVNVLDQREMLAAMKTTDGEKVVVNIMQRNKNLLRNAVG